jgi:hypothetical protein
VVDHRASLLPEFLEIGAQRVHVLLKLIQIILRVTIQNLLVARVILERLLYGHAELLKVPL